MKIINFKNSITLHKLLINYSI